MLGKQVWRILQSTTSLVSRLLKGQYFADSDILHVELGKKHSYMWKSLLEGRDLLRKGMRILLGDGKDTRIWEDSWLPIHTSRSPQPRSANSLNYTFVTELMNDPFTDWDPLKLGTIIHPDDVDIIKRIRLNFQSNVNILGWHYTKFGLYTVKSGYWLASHLPADDP